MCFEFFLLIPISTDNFIYNVYLQLWEELYQSDGPYHARNPLIVMNLKQVPKLQFMNITSELKMSGRYFVSHFHVWTVVILVVLIWNPSVSLRRQY
jgi:hypothetical protein